MSIFFLTITKSRKCIVTGLGKNKSKFKVRWFTGKGYARSLELEVLKLKKEVLNLTSQLQGINNASERDVLILKISNINKRLEDINREFYEADLEKQRLEALDKGSLKHSPKNISEVFNFKEDPQKNSFINPLEKQNNRLIFFVKFLTGLVWLYVGFKLVGDFFWMGNLLNNYLNPPLPPAISELTWEEPFLTKENLGKIESVITGEKLGPLVLNENTWVILDKTNAFLQGLETEVGLTEGDKKLIKDNISWDERSELYWLIDVTKELWVQGYEEERAVILSRIICLLGNVIERVKNG